MPNVNNPNGFLPYQSGTGNGVNKIIYLDLVATNASIGVGDLLEIDAGGVDKAEASDALCGAAAEAKAANTGGKIAVWADPMQVFVAQTDDGTGTATSAAAMRKNVNFVTGTAVNGRSIYEIDESTATTTATLPLKILGLSGDVNNAYGEFNRLLVKINNHQLGSSTGTVGLGT